MATWITGDLHGSIDYGKIDDFKDTRADVAPGDRLVILGDFGLVWGARTTEQEYLLKNLGDYPWNEVLWLDGNHEDFDRIEEIPIEDGWHGGRVQRVPGHPNIIHLMRGEVYDMGSDGKWFVMGGAQSIDRAWRTPHLSWWPQEIPNDEECDNAVTNLEKVGWKVDYVMTHDCPASIAYEVGKALGRDESDIELDRYEKWIQWIDDQLEYRRWWFGHWHIDVTLPGHHTCLYNNIVRLDDKSIALAESYMDKQGEKANG